ncbi:MAG: HAD hydrolase family protein [Stomatobaculum sp.]|nr:HAD hydrolase family protein [Stomatobaculum sp.]
MVFSIVHGLPALINALTERGAAFTYATARSIESARTIAGGLNLPLPAIIRNGCVLADNATGKHLEKALFTEEEIVLLKTLLPELPEYGFGNWSSSGIRSMT